MGVDGELARARGGAARQRVRGLPQRRIRRRDAARSRCPKRRCSGSAPRLHQGADRLSEPIRRRARRQRRGHDVAATRRAMRLLAQRRIQDPRALDAEPARLDARPRDVADFARIFDDPDFRPDELKIYPCSLIETAELMQYHESGGAWKPYEHDELLECWWRARARAGLLPCHARDPRHLVRRHRRWEQADELPSDRGAGARAARRAYAGDIRAREIRGESLRRRSAGASRDGVRDVDRPRSSSSSS